MSDLAIKTFATVELVAVLYFFGEEIKHSIKSLFIQACGLVSSTITIRRDQHRSYRAISQELGYLLDNSRTQTMLDCGDTPIYAPSPGYHRLRVAIPGYGLKWIMFCVSEDEIRAYSFGSIMPLRTYFDHIFKKYNSSDVAISYYSSNGDEWAHPMFRRPRDSQPHSITKSMQRVLDSVDTFVRSESLYKENGWPYRVGYMFHGEAGTGKSSIVELIATEYNMSVYTIQLNDRNMTDASLGKLCQTVPLRSIIVFDEIDKQFDAVIDNDTVHISKAGILSAIDGVPKLPHGTIVIMTANTMDVFDKEFRSQLCRGGRIDNVVELTDLFC